MNGTIEGFELSLARPLVSADRTIDARKGFVVEVENEGVTGIGEATPLPEATESFDDCEEGLEAALEALESQGRQAALRTVRKMPAARHGVSLALLDLYARKREVPLYRFLNDAADPTDWIPVNATIGDGTVEETVEDARAAVTEGFECVKVKVGARTTGVDAARLRSVREEVGDDVDLRADANGAWSFEEATDAAEAMPSAEYLEQPLAADDLAGHADLRRAVPIALDETLTVESPEDVVSAGAADVLVLKPMLLGGVDRASMAAEFAVKNGLDVVVSTTLDGVLARTGAVHLAASLEVSRACGLATADRLSDDLAPDPAPVEDGAIAVPPGPGHGVRLDE